MKHKTLIFFACWLALSGTYAQTYTGTFYASHDQGMHTDQWFNLLANSGATSSNNWNVYHKDGGSILMAHFGAPQAYVQIGSGRTTNFFVNGTAGIGISSPLFQTKFGVYEPGSSNSTWRGRIVASGDASAVVLGEFGGKASIGGHNSALNAWSDLLLQFDGGNTGIGTNSPTQKLTVGGNILQNAENSAIGLDAQPEARLGFVKKSGYGPVIASDNGSPIIFSQSNQTGVHTNIAGATLTERMRIDGNGNIGIGTSSPSGRLTVYNQGSGTGFVIGNPNTGGGGYTSLSMGTSNDTNGYSYLNSIKNSGSAYGDFIINKNGGNVGIGTSSPDATLTVNGTIHSTEVKVTTTVPGPDYVFEKDYPLPSLEQIKSYIDQNKHLPEVPSAKEMEANGVNLGEMNMLLLKKVEELTLYSIEQHNEIKNLKSEIADLRSKIGKR